MVNINDFFDFEDNSTINRIAYSIEDAKYKLKVMKTMQDIGMKISIDDVGNICGTFTGNYAKKKNLAILSHTDSVKDGGQFDGPVGVYMALKSAENFKNSTNKQYGNLRTIICACEESTRFSKACLGSSYVSGKLSYNQISALKDKKGISFNDAIAEYKDYIFSHLADYGIDLNNIELVDKIIEENEITEAIESHIEQSEILLDSDNKIGIIDSIGKTVRGDIRVNGKTAIVTSAKLINSLNKFALEAKLDGDTEEIIRTTVPKFNTLPDKENIQTIYSENSNLIKVTTTGKNNHSGATPMDKRQDAVLGMSDLILQLDNLQTENPNLNFEFYQTATEGWGANQIQDKADLLLKVTPSASVGIVNSFAEDITEKSNITFNISDVDKAEVQKTPSSELFVDIRQQYPIKGKETKDRVYNVFKDLQEEYNNGQDSISFKITSMDDPVKTDTQLLNNIKQICDEKNIPCQIMHSWPGHDVACILLPNNGIGKKILFFIPSSGGSHNPNEKTTKEAIELGTDVYSTLITHRMNEFQKVYEKEESTR